MQADEDEFAILAQSLMMLGQQALNANMRGDTLMAAYLSAAARILAHGDKRMSTKVLKDLGEYFIREYRLARKQRERDLRGEPVEKYALGEVPRRGPTTRN